MSRRQEEIAMLEMWWALAPPSPPRDINSEFIKACKQLAEMVGKSPLSASPAPREPSRNHSS